MGRERRLRIGAMILALVNMMPAVEADRSWGVLAIAGGAALFGLLLTRKDGRTPILRLLLFLSVFAAVGFLLYEMFFAGESVPVLALAHFMILLCSCKFLELRTNRDIGLVAVIAFLVLVIGALVSGSLLFGVVLAFDLTVGVAWLIAFQLKRDSDDLCARRRAAFATARCVPPRDDPFAPRGLKLTRAVLAGAVGMVAIAAALFVAVPRGWGRSFLGGIRAVVPVAVTGFTDEVQLRDMRTSESDAPVMRVRLTRDGHVIGSDDFHPYLRGATLDRYVSGRWARTPSQRSDVHQLEGGNAVRLLATPQLLPDDQIVKQEIWLDRVDSYLFTMYPPVAVSSPDIRLLQLQRRDRVLKTEDHLGRPAQYTVWTVASVPAELARIMRREASRTRRDRPSPSRIPKRVRALARQLKSKTGTPDHPADAAAIAEEIRAYLSGPDFEYTLDRQVSTPAGMDPVEEFLFNSRRGHCEYFASAMTLMCQSLDIKARLVGGFYGGTFNSVGGFYQFRQRDAHAWVEVYLPDRGWSTFDPSPARARDGNDAGTGLLAGLQRIRDYLQFKWTVFVVAFDAEVRRDLVGRFGEWFLKLSQGERGARFYRRAIRSFLWGPEFLTTSQRLFFWLLLVLCAAFALLLTRIVWIVSLMVRECLPARHQIGTVVVRRPESRFYDRLLLLLASKGHRKPPGMTPREFAERLAQTHADLSEVRDLTEWFYAAQYGGASLSPAHKERIRTLLQRLREDASFGVA